MIIHSAPQGTPEWHQARVGMFTASRASDMLAVIKSGEAAARRDLRVQLAVERLTGQSADDVFVNADMERGVELEPVAQRLGCLTELDGIRTIMRRGAGYQRQRAVARRNGGELDAVVASLVAEMRAGKPL